jgi:hypothetical protein
MRERRRTLIKWCILRKLGLLRRLITLLTVLATCSLDYWKIIAMNYCETDIACEEEEGWCKVVYDRWALKIDRRRAVKLENGDLALPEGSIAKRRGVRVMMMMIMMKRKEGQEGYDGRPNEPQSSWCKLPQHSGNLSLHSASPLALGPPYHTQSLLRRLNNRLCLHPRWQVRRSK